MSIVSIRLGILASATTGSVLLNGCVLGCLIPALPGAWQQDTDFGTGLSVLQSRDGGYVVIGEGAGGDHYTGPPYLLKTDAAGQELWSLSFAGGPAYPNSLVEATDGSLIVAGLIGWQEEGEELADVVRVSADGDVLWAREILASGQNTRYGGHVVATSDESFVATSPAGQGETPDVRIAKFDLEGTIRWTQILELEDGASLHDVAPAADGGVTVLTRASLLRLASDGSESWRVAPPQGPFGRLHLVATADDGVVVLTNDRIGAFDRSGAVIWDKVFPFIGGASVVDFHGLPDGGFVVGTSSGTVGYCRDMVLIKLSDGGDILWRRVYGSPDFEYLDGLAPTSDGGYIVLGTNGRDFFGFFNYMFLMKIDADESPMGDGA